MNSLRTGTDLSVAITATAIIEASLERLLISKFDYLDTNLKGQLFLNRGPLSDFHSKILIAQAFGVVTKHMAQELHSLKAIRNTFAHARVPLTFDHELIEKEVRSLRMFKSIVDAEKEAHAKFDLTNKNWFLLVIKVLLIMFADIEERPGNADEALLEALSERLPTSREKFW